MVMYGQNLSAYIAFREISIVFFPYMSMIHAGSGKINKKLSNLGKKHRRAAVMLSDGTWARRLRNRIKHAKMKQSFRFNANGGKQNDRI